jgi:hypothetical protein
MLEARVVTVRINGVRVMFSDQQPEIIEGRTLVPLRGVFDALGFCIDWDEETKTVTIEKADVAKVTFEINNPNYTIVDLTNSAPDRNLTLDVAPRILNGRTMVPIRYPLEELNLGYRIAWNGEHNTVLISAIGEMGSIPMVVIATSLMLRTAPSASAPPSTPQHTAILLQGTIISSNVRNPSDVVEADGYCWIRASRDGQIGWVMIREIGGNDEFLAVRQSITEEKGINGDLTRVVFSTYGSVDFTFDVTLRNNNAYIRDAIRSVDENGNTIEWVSLEDFIRIGEFEIDNVTWYGINKKTFSYTRSHFILREFMATRNSACVADVDMMPQGIMIHSIGVSNPTLRRHVGPSRDNPESERIEHRDILGINTNNNCWNRPINQIGRRIAVHAWIGTTRIGTLATYQVLPWNIRSWHSGTSDESTANNTHISFEICELYDTSQPRTEITELHRAFFNAAYKEAVQLCAYLCKLYNFNPLEDINIIDHYGGSYVEPSRISSRSHDVTHATNGIFSIFGKTNNEGTQIRRLDTFRNDVADVMAETL